MFYDSTPTAVSQLQQEFDAIIREVESDSTAINSYEPKLHDKLAQLKRRASARNILDCYRLSTELEEIFVRIGGRTTPFDFSPVVAYLKDEVQQCRDQFLSDPHSEKVWREIHYNEVRLREQRRHHEAMEEAAEAQAQAARESAYVAERIAEAAEEQNELLRQQRNAQWGTTVGTAANAYYARETANALRDIADKTNGSSD